jgi:hypothetical protein
MRHVCERLSIVYTAYFIADGILDMELALSRAAAASEDLLRLAVYVSEDLGWNKAWKEGRLRFATYPPADFPPYT